MQGSIFPLDQESEIFYGSIGVVLLLGLGFRYLDFGCFFLGPFRRYTHKGRFVSVAKIRMRPEKKAWRVDSGCPRVQESKSCSHEAYAPHRQWDCLPHTRRQDFLRNNDFCREELAVEVDTNVRIPAFWVVDQNGTEEREYCGKSPVLGVENNWLIEISSTNFLSSFMFTTCHNKQMLSDSTIMSLFSYHQVRIGGILWYECQILGLIYCP